MKSIFSRLLGNKNDGALETLDLETSSALNLSEEIRPVIMFPEHNMFTDEAKYILRLVNKQLEPMSENQIQLKTFSVTAEERDIEVQAFIRHSINQEVKFEDWTIILLDENKDIVKKQTFLLSELGVIPPTTSIPYTFYFDLSEIECNLSLVHQWSVAFEYKPPHELDLDLSWEDSLPENQKQQLRQLVNSLPLPNEDELNIMLLKSSFSENGLELTILVRNGKNQSLTVEQLPLEVKNQDGTLIARGGFSFNDFTVQANTSKPWIIIFPKESIQTEPADSDKLVLHLNQ